MSPCVVAVVVGQGMLFVLLCLKPFLVHLSDKELLGQISAH
jgi:hypothetical protein